MIKAPIIAIAAIGLAVVGGATALYVISGPGAIELPTEAYDEQTVFVAVLDLKQFDESAVDTIDETIRDFVDQIADALGEDGMSARDEDEFEDAMDVMKDVAEVIQEYEIEAFAVTVSIDMDEFNDSRNPEDSDAMITLLIKAASEPDLVELAEDLGDVMEEKPDDDDLEEFEDNVELEDLGGGWYSIEVDGDEGEFIGLPEGDDAKEAASRFNSALSNTAGGIMQFVAAPGTDILETAPDGDDLEEAYDAMPGEIQDVFDAMTEADMICFAADIDDGVGFRAYLIFEDSDDAKELTDALETMKEEMPDLLEEFADDNNIDEDEVEDLEEPLVAMLDLIDVGRSGGTVSFELDAEGFEGMTELMVELIETAEDIRPEERPRRRSIERDFEDRLEGEGYDLEDEVPETSERFERRF